LTGLVITIEGIEGSGKSTQVQRLATQLELCDIPVITTKEPGGTNLCKKLRSLLLESNQSSERWTPKAEMMLFYADRAQHIAELVMPMLQSGNVIIIDRFNDSTVAYQGASGIEDKVIDQLSNIVLGQLTPTVTLLLDIDPIESLIRVKARNQSKNNFREVRFDEEELAFHCLVRSRFLDIAKKDPNRVIVIPAGESPDIVESLIWAQVRTVIQQAGYRVK
jgi:dTMP kinase